MAISAPPSRTAASYALGVLMLVTLFSYIDRYVFNLLLPQVQADLHISDTRVGVLQGVAFGLFYSVMAVPFGLMVDRWNRRNLVAGAVIFWSLATIGCGLSHGFWQLLAARTAVGLGEAALMPAAMSIIVDLFPPERRGRALGIFSTAVFIGGGGSSLVGGAVLSAFGTSHSVTLPLLGTIAVWKAAFITIASPGLLAGLLALTIREPQRHHQIAAATPQGDSMGRFLRQHPKPFFYVLACYSIATFVSFSFFPWLPSLFVRSYHVSPATAGYAIGLGTLIMGILGSLTAGGLADRWTRQGKPGGKFRLTLIWWLLLAPTTLGVCLCGNFVLAAVIFAIYHFGNCLMYSSASATMQDMVPNELRGRTAALWFMVTGVIGQGFGPLSTALVTDHLFHNRNALPYSVIVVMIPCFIAGLAVSWLGIKPYDALRREVGKV